MEKFIIRGGNKLYGRVKLCGAKNSVLPLLAGSILTKEKVVLHDCPDISDVRTMLNILSSLGAMVERSGRDIIIQGGVQISDIPYELAKEIRSSIFLLGSLIATTGGAKVAYPGGCDIGQRPIDIHIKGLRELNVDITELNGCIICKSEKLIGADIQLDKNSVGATENLIMASVIARGCTIIRNAAKEPEIVDLANLLNKMGAKIVGAGTSVIQITGVDALHGAEHTPIPDRIVAGTLMTAVGMTGGEIEIENVIPEHIFAITSKLIKSACNIRCFCDRIQVASYNRSKSVDIETSPYPGFPTDMQAQFTTLNAVSEGTGIIIENIFETRFKHVPELRRMGANISVHNDIAVIRGVKRLCGAEVMATDLRGGSALVLAGLCADGQTIVDGVRHIDRGYERFDEMLLSLGAKIQRIDYE